MLISLFPSYILPSKLTLLPSSAGWSAISSEVYSFRVVYEKSDLNSHPFQDGPCLSLQKLPSPNGALPFGEGLGEAPSMGVRLE